MPLLTPEEFQYYLRVWAKKHSTLAKPVPTIGASIVDMGAGYPALMLSKIVERTGEYDFSALRRPYQGATRYYFKGYLPTILLEAFLAEEIKKILPPPVAAFTAGLLSGAVFAIGETDAIRNKLKLKTANANASYVRRIIQTVQATRGIPMTAVREGFFALVVFGKINKLVEKKLLDSKHQAFRNEENEANFLTKFLGWSAKMGLLCFTAPFATVASYQQGVPRGRITIFQAAQELRMEAKMRNLSKFRTVFRGGWARIFGIATTSLVLEPASDAIAEYLGMKPKK